jgi:cyclopropane fatty-acyl-phospholipid synthase-like methyltransferase
VRFAKVFLLPIEGKSVLEFGFGDGKDLLYFYSKGCNCYGIEASKEVCDLFLQRAQHLDMNRIKIGDYHSIRKRLAKGSIDFIYSINVLHYMGSKKKISELIKKFYNLLGEGGNILISLVHPQHYFMDNSVRVNKDCREFTNEIPEREGLRFILFETRKEIQGIFSIFKNIHIGSHEHSYDLQKRHVFWLVTGNK